LEINPQETFLTKNHLRRSKSLKLIYKPARFRRRKMIRKNDLMRNRGKLRI